MVFRESKATLSIALHPSRTVDIAAGIDEQLNEFLMQFVEDLGGVVLAFSDVEILQKNAMLYFDQPHVHFSIRVKFLLFCPVVGDYLGILLRMCMLERIVGVINKISVAHIGMLVHGVFNVSIPTRLIRNDFKYEIDPCRYTHSNKKFSLDVGTSVRFQVTAYIYYFMLHTIDRVSDSTSLFSLSGSLRPRCCGAMEEVADIELTNETEPVDSGEPLEKKRQLEQDGKPQKKKKTIS